MNEIKTPSFEVFHRTIQEVFDKGTFFKIFID